MLDRLRGNQGISTEAKIMIGSILAVIVIGLGVAYLIPRVKEFVAVDRCLDAGGSYNQQAKACERSRATTDR
jgi:hypothetical protein